MASEYDHDEHDGCDPLDTTQRGVLDRTGELEAGDADSLEALRGTWLRSAAGDESALASINAATEPLSIDEQEQIVQRLLREGGRATRRRTRAAMARRARSFDLRRVPGWSFAAACALCGWIALHA